MMQPLYTFKTGEKKLLMSKVFINFKGLAMRSFLFYLSVEE
jgi:hypothetical protein